MKISARVDSNRKNHNVILKTNDYSHSLTIPPKSNGQGSGVNGGELLFLALATCYCNDIYREAKKRNIIIDSVEVEVEGEFDTEGKPAKNVFYRTKVTTKEPEQDVRLLLKHTDQVSEIQNSLRNEIPIALRDITIVES